MKKTLIAIILIALVVIANMSTVMAIQPGSLTGTTSTAATQLLGPGGKIIFVFQVIGSIAAVAVLTYVGIKFMLASPGEKAAIKGMLIPYIVGAVIIFAAPNLVAILYKMRFQ